MTYQNTMKFRKMSSAEHLKSISVESAVAFTEGHAYRWLSAFYGEPCKLEELNITVKEPYPYSVHFTDTDEYLEAASFKQVYKATKCHLAIDGQGQSNLGIDICKDGKKVASMWRLCNSYIVAVYHGNACIVGHVDGRQL